ncbi:MAG TPA: bifunctional hydroxymethylpyrimidine kinase/phosphomethylpyrimidine kinase [Polyangiaceae bacterium]|jgi:hydroxymethylpyrimidine/phosphomethylpyrimidine kinase|nr:bifunctional hydroxymethylpyrimidine kinase/phosphomethylpyrimidine kinase [Polyangiaceae bacterium]
MTIPRALTIAGSDSGGGAGIQADLKTFSAFGAFGMSAIAALTAQNTLGVTGIHAVPIDFLALQIDAVMSDIGANGVKTGMLATAAVVELVAAKVREHRIENLVVDPVMVAKSGHTLLEEGAQNAVREVLLPLALVATPNLPEAEVLTKMRIEGLDGMREAAVRLHDRGVRYAVIKGGHLENTSESIDIVFDGREHIEIRAPRISTRNTHGTGCTFSAAIAAGLARGLSPIAAIRRAKRYVTRAIEGGLAIGAGHGPTNHLAGVTSEWTGPEEKEPSSPAIR